MNRRSRLRLRLHISNYCETKTVRLSIRSAMDRSAMEYVHRGRDVAKRIFISMFVITISYLLRAIAWLDRIASPGKYRVEQEKVSIFFHIRFDCYAISVKIQK